MTFLHPIRQANMMAMPTDSGRIRQTNFCGTVSDSPSVIFTMAKVMAASTDHG